MTLDGDHCLAQVQAGRHYVLASQVTEAVVLGMRAHGSEVVVFDEGCYFVAALAYGGPEARKVALDAKADMQLASCVRRFGSKRSHAKTVDMARTIWQQLQKGWAEQGLAPPSTADIDEVDVGGIRLEELDEQGQVV